MLKLTHVCSLSGKDRDKISDPVSQVCKLHVPGFPQSHQSMTHTWKPCLFRERQRLPNWPLCDQHWNLTHFTCYWGRATSGSLSLHLCICLLPSMVAQEVNSRHSPVSRKGSRALKAAGTRVGFPRFFSLLAFPWEHPTLLRLINSQQGTSDLKVTINREVSGLWLRENCLGSSFALQS